MKLYSMTATFGKLENQTLTLQPGLNIIHAPNEWGKSTWCAFLAVMLYGLDTREKTTKSALATKERFAPWSGSPMAGRIDLCWNGRDITIERWTKGRTPMGEFRAYETSSGIAVPELTAAGCGETLLGVERSVFLRAGFLRLSDLPVTQDESLRRRLNALVTTGDESQAGDLLAQKLKDLKNKCRYNRSGLIPQAEAQRRELEDKLAELQDLQQQSQSLQARQQELQHQIAALENHRRSLQYQSTQAGLQQVEKAHMEAEAAAERMARLEEECLHIPSQEALQAQLSRHLTLQQTLSASLQEANLLPPEPPQPQIPQQYQNLSPVQAIAAAQADAAAAQRIESKQKQGRIWLLSAALLSGIGLLAVIAALLFAHSPLVGCILGGLLLAAGATLFLVHFLGSKQLARTWNQLCSRYPYPNPEHWVEDAEFYAETMHQYENQLQDLRARRQVVDAHVQQTQAELSQLLGSQDPQSWEQAQRQLLSLHDALWEARRSHRLASAHADALRAMIRPAEKPTEPDDLPYSEAETDQLQAKAAAELQQVRMGLGQCQGRMDMLGTEAALRASLEAVCARLEKLEQTHHALELALHTLEDATAALQRRFAPRIAQQAQALFSRLTGGRYDRLTLSQDFSVNTGAEGETVLHTSQWRSEGTVDQLYLALRLAVARELTPHAPMVLDDALVRFDDDRHRLAMEVLRQEAETKQILLFTCQSRENMA